MDRNPYIGKVLLLLLATAAPLYATTHVTEDLFQKAMLKESVERNPEAAIHLYQQVLDQAEDNPALIGEVRFRIGICFEKIGKPQQAEGLYREILSESSGVSSNVLQQARNNLGRLQVEHPEVFGSSMTVRDLWRHRYSPTRLSLLIGPSLLMSNNGTPATGLSTGLRFRVSASSRPAAWFLEARVVIPLTHSEVADQARGFDSQGTDNASLKFRYQTSLGLVNELPHGNQRTAIPEMGAGVELTSAKISYTNNSSSGDLTQRTWSPYLETGVHLFPDRIVSVLFQARYVVAPYPKSVDIQTPPHSQTFNFPSSQWAIGATLQIKIGRFIREPRP